MKTKIIIICTVFLMLLNVPIVLQAKRMVYKKEVAPSSRLQLSRYGYTGQEKEWELKSKKEVYNYRARMYDPTLRRFLSFDKANQGAYNFCLGNPVGYKDENGQWAIPAHTSIEGLPADTYLYGSDLYTADRLGSFRNSIGNPGTDEGFVLKTLTTSNSWDYLISRTGNVADGYTYKATPPEPAHKKWKWWVTGGVSVFVAILPPSVTYIAFRMSKASFTNKYESILSGYKQEGLLNEIGAEQLSSINKTLSGYGKYRKFGYFAAAMLTVGAGLLAYMADKDELENWEYLTSSAVSGVLAGVIGVTAVRSKMEYTIVKKLMEEHRITAANVKVNQVAVEMQKQASIVKSLQNSFDDLGSSIIISGGLSSPRVKSNEKRIKKIEDFLGGKFEEFNNKEENSEFSIKLQKVGQEQDGYNSDGRTLKQQQGRTIGTRRSTFASTKKLNGKKLPPLKKKKTKECNDSQEE